MILVLFQPKHPTNDVDDLLCVILSIDKPRTEVTLEATVIEIGCERAAFVFVNT